MTLRTLFLGGLSAAMLIGALGGTAFAAEKRSMCVYDPNGRSGQAFTMLQAYRDEADGWGVDFEFKPFTDEATAVGDFEAGQCDAVFATGVRLQRFNRSAFTIEAIGAFSDYAILRDGIKALARDSSASLMRQGDYETVGILPGGAVYLLLRDRAIDTVPELAGKRIATMNFDRAAPVMVERVGATVVAADLGTFGPMFNNGDVDACYTSAVGYRPFELWKGLDAIGGGIVKFPVAQLTFQIVIRADRFPEGFGKASRSFVASQFDVALKTVEASESDIPDKYWMTLDAQRIPEFEEMFLQVRLDLRDGHKAYDGRVLGAFRKLRCHKDPARAECVDPKE